MAMKNRYICIFLYFERKSIFKISYTIMYCAFVWLSLIVISKMTKGTLIVTSVYTHVATYSCPYGICLYRNSVTLKCLYMKHPVFLFFLSTMAWGPKSTYFTLLIHFKPEFWWGLKGARAIGVSLYSVLLS